MMIQQLVGKFAPANLPQISLAPGATSDGSVAHQAEDCAPNLSGTNLAEVQVRREPGCANNARLIPAERIFLNGFFLKALQLALRSGFARLPSLAKAACTIDCGFEL